MFNLQGSEIIIVLLLALVVLGPEKLPDAMRKMGQFYAELKKMSSGFQSEFKAAIDEPMREMKDTANVLRDSADFTKLQSGERDEKPKSGEMPTVDEPAPDFESPADADQAPAAADDSKPAPFSGVSSAAPQPAPVVDDSEPAVFPGDHLARQQAPATDESRPAVFPGDHLARQPSPAADDAAGDLADDDPGAEGSPPEGGPEVDDPSGHAR